MLGIRRMYRVPNTRITELCGVRKSLHERIDEGVLRWFDHVERMERDWSPRESMWESVLVVVQWVGHGRDGLIP